MSHEKHEIRTSYEENVVLHKNMYRGIKINGKQL